MMSFGGAMLHPDEQVFAAMLDGLHNQQLAHISYHWRLRKIMATRGPFITTQLAPLLAERGMTLTGPQSTASSPAPPNGSRFPCPPRSATCSRSTADLIATRAENTTARKTVGATRPTAVGGPVELRPARARLRPES